MALEFEAEAEAESGQGAVWRGSHDKDGRMTRCSRSVWIYFF